MTLFLNLSRVLNGLIFFVGIGTIGLLNINSVFAQNTPPFYSIEYRPYKGNWLQLKTPNFRVIYPEGLDSIAYYSGRILEQQYPLAQSLTGGF